MEKAVVTLAQFKIGVVGYCPPTKFDESEARRLLDGVFAQIVEECGTRGYSEVIVVSGLADVGVPALAYRVAGTYGWSTSGIACEKVYDFEEFPVDYRQIVGKNWGDESDTFLAECNVLVRIGGGKQSRDEVAAFGAKGGTVYERELAALPG